jgi:Domain of unknown function (DUF397)
MTEHWHDVLQDELASGAFAPATWRRRSHSGTSGNCAEAVVLDRAKWRKSTYSGDQGNCVEIAGGLAGAVAVRDSKNPDGTVLVFTRGAWTAFTGQVHRGELARP